MKPRLYSFLLVMMLALACEAQNLIMTCGPYALRRPGTCALVHQGEGFASIIYAEGVREQCALFLGETEEESYENLMAMVRMIQREENEYYWPIDDSTTVWYNNFRGRHYVVINRVGQEGNVWLYS
ncbi:MAG: hypothetical protein J5808_00120, partial [Paludibacteraceae bacterium]|nr:hypothetical protein [Paludibacteraceae bacterium]